ncbi:MAG TPA: extracellular solute-binding protein [Tepidisphaeraceae bacterium]
MLGGALCVLVFGPRPEPAVPAERSHDVIIHYWEKWLGPEYDAIQQVVNDFNGSVGREKHIYVELMSMSDIDQKTLVATAGGVPPDVAGLWDPMVVQLGSLGALEPLEDLAKAHGITGADYKPVYWKGSHFEGHLYALPSTPGAVALFYNTRIFRENAAKLRAAGLDPDRAPETIDELDRYSDVLTTFVTDEHGNRHVTRVGYLPMPPEWDWYVTSIPLWFGAEEWDPNSRQFTLTDPRVIQAFHWMESFPRKLGVAAVSEFFTSQGGFDTAQNSFMLGTQVMELQGPWMALYIHHNNPSMDHDWAVAPFPTAVPGLKNVTYCPFDTLMIPRGCKHIPEAFEFIAYVNQQPVMEKLCMLHCKGSPLAKVSWNFLHHHPNPYIGVFEMLASSPNAHMTMQCPIAQEAGAELTAIVQGVLALEVDPVPALERAQVRLQARYEEFERALKRRMRTAD